MATHATTYHPRRPANTRARVATMYTSAESAESV
jgi:hypothetical protein